MIGNVHVLLVFAVAYFGLGYNKCFFMNTIKKHTLLP